MDRACPGMRVINPFSYSFSTIWCTVGGLTLKPMAMPISAGG